MIAAGTFSMLNDKYFGQCLVMNVPVTKLHDFHERADHVMEKRYRNFAFAMHHASDFWGTGDAIREAMELEAHGKAHIETTNTH